MTNTIILSEYSRMTTEARSPKLATDKTLNMKLKLEIEIKGDVSGQKRDETRVALQELGLNDDIREVE
ncbi:MAG: hypothetical protein N5P05_002727 [Chroococcopsis gigantea SAG 12.99]|jgi:hypothetical protein|nr:hypothetical protein [Chroococcopsis gigantea SAG 12.99]